LKIYLINPKFPVTYWGFTLSNDLSGMRYTTPPLALATLAGLTPAGIDVEICDENIEEIDYNRDCDIVGVTSYLMQAPRAFEIAARFRERGKTVVVGGPVTTLSPESCEGKADVLFIGEAEYTWPRFLSDYRQGTHRAEYVQKEKVQLQDSPVPRMDLLKLEKYAHGAIQTTRGCPYGCEFCDIIVLFGRKVRCKTIPQVIAEMQAISAQGANSIFFTDDNFIGNRRYAKELLRAIIEFNKTSAAPLQYLTQVSIDLARDDELLELLHEARFTRVFIGIETPRKASLQEAQKGQNVRSDLVTDIRKIQGYNIDVTAGMIVGFDHDDTSIFREQFEFIMEANISWAMVGMLQAIPKTPLYERLERENRLDATGSMANNTSIEANIIPKSMTKEELVSGYYRLCRQVYDYDNYAQRIIGMLKRYARKPAPGMHVPSIAQIAIVLRTFRYYLLTMSRRRMKFFWTIMSYVLLRKPHAFYDAMVHLVGFKHMHAYVYEHLDRAYAEKVAAFEHSALQSKKSLASAFEELRNYAAFLGQKVTKGYDDLIAQIGIMGQHAAVEFEDVQTARAYEDLRKQASDLSQRVLAECGELRKRAAFAMSGQILTAEFEELGKQLAVFNASIADAFEELKLRSLALSERLAAAAAS
jgi:radical SAM superfamily enzyme YgiQ (UPF0313 family)